jgi:F0F1-type ATP synthase assembly protein I
MNETSTFRRVAATLTIGSFSVAALMGIVALLGGGDFGEGEARVLLTTLIVGCASICVLCYLATAGTPWATAGVLGAVVLVLPTASALILVWSDWSGDEEGLLKAFGVGVVGAVSLAQVCLLLALAGAREALRLLLGATVLLALVVALIISGLILGEIDADGVWRLLGVTAILDVLGTLVTVALAKFGGREDRVAPGHDGRTRITLPAEQARAIGDLAGRTGRSRDDLVAEAVDRYLRAVVS